MAFLRFNRDKRGYEHFYLVQPSTKRGKSSARVLYWFRTPPNVKVGREPFDETIRRELESQNPDVIFDWRKILDTPIPSADAEKWRDRRRAERAAKVARRAAAPVGEPSTAEEADVEEAIEDSADEAPADAPVHVLEAAAEAAEAFRDSSGVPDLTPGETSNEHADEPFDALAASPSKGELAQDQPQEIRTNGSGQPSRRKRRRRRRRRGGSGPSGPGGTPPAGTGSDV